MQKTMALEALGAPAATGVVAKVLAVAILAAALGAATIVAGTVLAGPAEAAATDVRIRIVNKAAEEILHVFAKDRDDTFWGRDRLREVLWRGRSGNVVVGDGSRCQRDLRAVARSGRSVELAQVDVCANRVWTIEDRNLR